LAQCSSVWKRLYFLWLYDNFLYLNIYTQTLMVLPDVSFRLPFFFGARNVHRSVLRKHRTTVFNFYGNHLQEPHIFTYMYICRRLYDGEREKERARSTVTAFFAPDVCRIKFSFFSGIIYFSICDLRYISVCINISCYFLLLL
jgi:hypothetical protein